MGIEGSFLGFYNFLTCFSFFMFSVYAFLTDFQLKDRGIKVLTFSSLRFTYVKNMYSSKDEIKFNVLMSSLVQHTRSV